MSNFFDEQYEIRQAKYEEIPEIMEFIDKYWKKGHILAVNRDFFEYQYVEKGKEVNFFIAINRETKEIEGLHGFIYTNSKFNTAWGSIWEVRNDHPNLPFLGLEIAKRIPLEKNLKYFLTIGGNPKTNIPLRTKILHDKSAKLNHYYRLQDKKDYKTARIENKIILKKPTNIMQIEAKEVFSFNELKQYVDFSSLKNIIPFKDEWYYERRFFNYPIYKYRAFVLAGGGEFFIAREQETNSGKILRIVDWAGNQEKIQGLWDFFDKLIKENNFEYIDFYNFNFNDQYLRNAGFILKEGKDNNIIPEYFYPFVQKNIDIYIAFQDENTVFCKADGDQDRPQLV